MTNRVYGLSCALAALFFILLLFSRFVELSVVLDQGGIRRISSSDGSKYPIRRAPILSSTDVEIELLPPAQGDYSETYFVPPKTTCGGKWRDLSQYTVVRGDWKIWGNWKSDQYYAGGRWFATKPGSILRWSGFVSESELNLLAHPLGGQVEIRVLGRAPQRVDLHSTTEQWKTISIASVENHRISQLSLWPDKYRLDLSQNGKIRSIYARFGKLRWLVPFKQNGSNWEIEITSADTIRAFALIAKSFLKLFFFTLVVLVFLAAIGLVISSPLLKYFDGADWFALLVGSGYVLTGAALSTLIYYFSVKAGLVIFLAALALWAVWKRSGIISSVQALEWKSDRSEFALLALTGISAAAVCFFPALLEEGWFFGQSLTDAFDYIGWSQALLVDSFPDAKIAAWRVLDLIYLSLFGLLRGSDSRAAFDVVGFSLLCFLPFLLRFLFRCADLRPLMVVAAVCAGTFAATFYSLFSQDYIAQYEATFVLLFCIALVSWSPKMNALASKDHSLTAAILAAIAFGAMLSIYPYFSVPALVFGVYFSIVAVQKRQFQPLLLGIFVGIGSLLVTNRNLWVLLDLSTKAQHFDHLNLLAQTHVIPLWNSVYYIYIMLGLRDFGVHSAAMPKLAEELVTQNLFGQLLTLLLSAGRAMECYAAPVTGIFALAGFFAFVRSANVRTHLFLANIVLFLAGTAYLYLTGQYYSFAKFSFLAGWLVLILSAVGIGVLLESSTRTIRVLGSVFFVTLLALNLVSTVYQNSTALIPRGSALLLKLRSHVSVISPELLELPEAFANLRQNAPETSQIGFYGSFTDCIETDKDRVLYNRVLHELRPWTVRDNDLGAAYHSQMTYLSVPEESLSDPQLNYLFSFRGYAPQDQLWEEKFCNRLFCFYKRR